MNEIPMVQIVGKYLNCRKGAFKPEGRDRTYDFFTLLLENPNPTSEFDMAFALSCSEEVFTRSTEELSKGNSFRFYGTLESKSRRTRIRIVDFEALKK